VNPASAAAAAPGSPASARISACQGAHVSTGGRGAGPAATVVAAPAGEAGQFPALDVGDPQRVGVAELPGEVCGLGGEAGGAVEPAGEQLDGGPPGQCLPPRGGVAEPVRD